MEISTIGRPRNVGWVRAAALMYGDWGTSKAYFIGLGVAAIGFTALPHLLAVCLLTGVVGLNYIWVCKHFPNGGGVYTAAGLHSRRLATIGGLLLLADFIVTAALSCLDAFKYLGAENAVEAKKWAITAIFAVGAMNFFGPKHTGGIAVWLAVPTLLVVALLIAGGVPHMNEFHPQPPTGGLVHNWTAFVGMILALSGVEVAASSTGVLKLDPHATPDNPSVLHTARRAILVVMIDIVIASGLLCVLAMCLPPEAREHQDDLLRFMGLKFYGAGFAAGVGWIVGLLLLSAVNTALTGIVALLYVMARDGELPEPFLQLNRFGVPWVALITGTILPVIVLNVDDSVEGLSHLYAIGVVGAIAINLGSCAFAKKIELRGYERVLMKLTFFVLAAIWITIAISKLQALIFVIIILGVGLGVRELTSRHQRAAPVPPATAPATVVPVTPAAGTPPVFLGQFILVAARGWTPALQFALEESRVREAQLLVLYVREVAVNIDMGGTWESDPPAKELFTRLETEARGLKVNKLYSISDSPADTIIDIAATFGVDTVVLGGSRRATLVNLLKGNVVARVAANLPDPMHLIVIG
jgi:L-asparagine transporter-like permease/nucleotide-binding universal stress UspA family protein